MILQAPLSAGFGGSSVAPVSGADLSFLVTLLWGLGALIAVIVAVYVGLLLMRRRYRGQRARFGSVVMQVTLPKFRRAEESERGPSKDQVQEAVAAAETFFSAVGGLKAQKGFGAWLKGRTDEMSFEIVAHRKLIKFFVAIPRDLQSFLEQTLSAAYPDAHIEEVEDYNIFSPTGVILGSYLTFKRADVFPFKTYKKLDTDPLNAVTNVLAKAGEEEGAAFQFVVRSAPGSWRKPGLDIAAKMQQGTSLDKASGGGDGMLGGFLEVLKESLGGGGKKEETPEKEHRLSPLEEEAVRGLEEKASKAGMDVCIRLVTSAPNSGSAQSLMNNMLNAFSQFSIYQYGNSFEKDVPRSNKKMIEEFIHREFDEKRGIVLNTEEMASLWHLPLPWTETPNIQWLGARRAPAPSNVPGPEDGDLELGFNKYRGVKRPVYMKTVDRARHMYLIGKSGSGKSQTLAKYIVQDIRAGHGVAVVEPHGDLVEQVLGNIPKERIDDVIYFCPSDLERPMGLNMLEAKDESMKDFAVQEMIAIFYKLFPPEMIGPMFEHSMRNVMLTLMADHENPGTIAEIPRMFTDEKYAQKWVDLLKDPMVLSFWRDEMAKQTENTKSEMVGYLVSKVGRFVENEMMRNIIGQNRSAFDFREVMDKQKILLVNLSKGKTGDVNAELLGLIIVSKLQMAALGRADMPEADRKDFFLYIDEFQNFITDSIATILSEARKYRLNLVIAHQYVGQLVKNGDASIREAVFGNVGTMFTARIGPEDVDILEPIYAPDFSGYDLINSDMYTWYVKMIVDNSQVKPFTMNLDPVGKGDPELASAIKELSRLKYGRDRAIVEAEILERTQLGASH